ncbi:hypothetical protein EPA93_17270 [Ktedonosporobacter rubrisoli]|uniref:histidine kinase n=1 Tax=Ktedonosporobacter rubrisoli TaxID=2509675 RepID=A0A4V0YYW6_KTERU|nr:sensor histidine kinase [Ktedonosporobacter rubrisoli]QBD77651.1 hypothetical protein EPA93_17270 [Ktedonosporobacter rubrisoli]
MTRKLCASWNWRLATILSGFFLLALALTLVFLLLPGMPKVSRDQNADYIWSGILIGLLYITGNIIFHHTHNKPVAMLAYCVFICTALICCLLLISTYRWCALLINLLSILTQGLAATFVNLLYVSNEGEASPKTLLHKLFWPYTWLISSFVMALVDCAVLLLLPYLWIVVALLIYVFTLVCMGRITWIMLFHSSRLSAQDKPMASMAVICIVFLFLPLALNSNNALYNVPLFSTSTGFLVFYCACIAGFVLLLCFVLYSVRYSGIQLANSLSLVSIGCTILFLLLAVNFVGAFDFSFWKSGITNLFKHHLLAVPLMLLPFICCYALLHDQLIGKAGLLSRQLIRSMLWLELACCFIVMDVTLIALERHFLPFIGDSEGISVHIVWFMLSVWLFPRVWEKVRDLGDKIFYRDFYHYNRTLRDLSTALTHLRGLEQISAFILPRLATLLNVAEIALLVREEMPVDGDLALENTKVLPGWRSYFHRVHGAESEAESAFRELIKRAITPLDGREYSYSNHDNLLLFPLFDGYALRGYLCLSHKLNNERYSRQDLSFLETLGAQLVVMEANTRYLEQAHRDALQQASLNHRIIQAQEEERRRLALELHDEALQQAMLLTRHLADNRGDTKIAEMEPLARSLVSSLRATCLELRPPLLDELGLTEALSWLARQSEQRGKIRVSMQCIGDPRRFSAEKELALYRVAQEALANVLKHAEASKVRIRLRYSGEDKVVLLVADNGRGLRRARPLTGSLGLAGMAERMEAVQGSFRLWAREGKGVVVRVCIQLR